MDDGMGGAFAPDPAQLAKRIETALKHHFDDAGVAMRPQLVYALAEKGAYGFIQKSIIGPDTDQKIDAFSREAAYKCRQANRSFASVEDILEAICSIWPIC